MKKLNLQLGSIKEMLTKEEMKKITGGSGYYDHPPGNSIVQCFPVWGNPNYPDGSPSSARCPYSDTTPSACISFCESIWGSPCDCALGSCHGRMNHTCG